MSSQLPTIFGSDDIDTSKPHFVLVPHLGQGHIILMLDMARLIADHGAIVSFITTPVNLARIKLTINQVKLDGLPIRFIEVMFPCAEVGLPEGCECIDLIPFNGLHKFLKASSLLQDPLGLYLREVKPVPSCMIVDSCCPWTTELAEELNIPRIIFQGTSCFYAMCIHNIHTQNMFDGVDDEYEPVVVTELPQRIELSCAEALGGLQAPEWEDFGNKMFEAAASADGVVFNTFHELEPEIIEYYEKATRKRVWPIGPTIIPMQQQRRVNGSNINAMGGGKSSIDEHQVVSWLDNKEPKSVMFVSFGSMGYTKPLQFIEIGCGLQLSNRPFLWVIKDDDKYSEVDKWMSSEGFEERIKDRGLIIKGWAPQPLILSHASIGGFMTHFGWNSIIEAITAGVPVITWPHFVDQFINAKFVIEVLKIGVSVGVKTPLYDDEVLVNREEVEKAIVSFLDEGREGGKEMIERVAKLSDKARKAMEEEGSSSKSMTLLIEYIKEHAKKKKKKKDVNFHQS